MKLATLARRMRWIGVLLALCLCAGTLRAQPRRDSLPDLPPPCDSQNSGHRRAVIESSAKGEPALADLSEAACAESIFLSLLTLMERLALEYARTDIELGIGGGEELAPWLENWRAWAARFIAGEPATRVWLGSFDNYRGQGIEVGCASYLLPVDIAVARGGNTLTELSLALSALFDPERNHPDSEVATEDWIKELGLSVEGIHLDQGLAEIRLGGRLRGIGTCGDAILEAQILQTVFQFADIKRAKITDGETNLWEVVDMSDRLTAEERRNYIYERADLYWLR